MYWLLPAAFIVHDLEELFTVPWWVAAHRSQLAAFARSAGLPEDVVDRLPTSLPAFAGAVAILLVLFLGVTWGATRTRGRGPLQFTFALLLGGFFLHGFTAVVAALLGIACFIPATVLALEVGSWLNPP